MRRARFIPEGEAGPSRHSIQPGPAAPRSGAFPKIDAPRRVDQFRRSPDMTEHYPLPRSAIGRPMRNRWPLPLPALPDTRKEVMAFTDQNPAWKPMLSLYDQLCAEGGNALFGSAIMGGGLVLADRADVAHNEGVVLIYFYPKRSRFVLSYRHSDVHPEQAEECTEAEIWERLRLYLAYKFGVRISQKGKKGEQAGRPNAAEPPPEFGRQ
jgi:hypothetical protein